MQALIDNFHFLRPYWLLGLLPVLVLATLLWRYRQRSSDWQQLIPAHLLRHLLEGSTSRRSRWPLLGLSTAWVIACLALAGPTWQRLAQPLHQSEAAVVILFDMSPSMVAEDVKPSRLQRARFKLDDYLAARHEGLTALVAYSGEAHVVSPLTDDTNTIANLLPALHPAIMPLPGSNVEMAVQKATNLFRDAGVPKGEILLVTDGVAEEALPELRELLQESPFRLSVLGVGTAEGAPIPTGEGGFARSEGNDIVIARLNERELHHLSRDLGGAYAGITADGRDVDFLLAHSERQSLLDEQQRLVDRQFDVWQDAGQWLALLLLPVAALAFRRGWLLSVGLVAIVGTTLPGQSHAFEWRDLWQRSDQQGRAALQAGDPASAAAEFEDSQWRGSAHYRAENYPAAAEAFAAGDSATAHYNQGNALAKAGHLEEALAAYEQALALQPEFPDASFNADLVRDLLKQKQEEQGQQQSGQQAQDENSKSEQQSSQDGQQDSQSGQQDSQQEQGEQQQGQQAQSGQEQEQANSEQSDSEQAGSEEAQPPSGEQEVDEQAARELADRQDDREPEQSEREMRAAQAEQKTEGEPPQDGPPATAALASQQEMDEAEQQQALEQWLRQIPDDPGGLLRRKFEYEHRRMRQQYRSGDWLPPENDAFRRW